MAPILLKMGQSIMYSFYRKKRKMATFTYDKYWEVRIKELTGLIIIFHVSNIFCPSVCKGTAASKTLFSGIISEY
jgi:hypothetical protein